MKKMFKVNWHFTDGENTYIQHEYVRGTIDNVEKWIMRLSRENWNYEGNDLPGNFPIDNNTRLLSVSLQEVSKPHVYDIPEQ